MYCCCNSPPLEATPCVVISTTLGPHFAAISLTSLIAAAEEFPDCWLIVTPEGPVILLASMAPPKPQAPAATTKAAAPAIYLGLIEFFFFWNSGGV